MATKEQIEIAVAVVTEVAGAPESGAIADLIKLLQDSANTTKEVRVIEPKEKR